MTPSKLRMSSVYHIYKLIRVEAGRLIAAHRTSSGSFALRESEAAATKCPAGTEITPTL